MFSAGSLPPPKTSIIQPKQQLLPDGKDKDRMVMHPLALALNDANSIMSRLQFIRGIVSPWQKQPIMQQEMPNNFFLWVQLCNVVD
eukprot:11862078-Ditylum_brightwellii.AAC.1